MSSKVSVRKLTDTDLMREAAGMTIDATSGLSLAQVYKCEHSPMRTQLFWITLENIPTFVSVHLVRHKIGVEHFVKSNRPDRNGGNTKIDRNTPVNHGMLINAEALINMAKKRLCHQASIETRKLMIRIKLAVEDVDPDLAKRMVPMCEYRGGVCHELHPCRKEK